MVKAYEIAEALHKRCVGNYIPNGLSPEHTVSGHNPTTSYYADIINEAGFSHISGEEFIEAVMAVTNWDEKSPWPGHPHPDLVIEYLRGT